MLMETKMVEEIAQQLKLAIFGLLRFFERQVLEKKTPALFHNVLSVTAYFKLFTKNRFEL